MHRRHLLQTAALTATASALGAASSTAPIPIAQIGTKHAHAAGKLATIRKFPALFDLAGVVEPDDAQRARVENQPPYDGVPWLTESEILSRSDIPVIVVETEVEQLVPTALRCVRAGKHLHLDKPGGTTLEPFHTLLNEARTRNLTIQMGYMFRYNPAFRFLFDAARQGWLGEIREVHGNIGKMASAATREDLAQYEGGGMFELACHLIDALVTVMGPPDRVTAFHRRSHPGQDSFHDNQLAVFEYPGALATIRCNHVDPFGGPRRQFQVIGEAGAIEIRPLEPPRLTVMLDRPRATLVKGIQEVALPPLGGRYDGDFMDLAAIVRGETHLAWNYDHDLAVQRAVLEASQ